MSKRTLIIGGGLIGVTTLHELAARGREVVLLEARDGLAEGASQANGGMATPSMPEPWNSPGVWRHLAASLFDPYAAMKLRFKAIPGLAFWGLQFLHGAQPRLHHAAAVANFALARYSLDRIRALTEQFGLDYDGADCGTMKIFESREAMTEPRRQAELLHSLGQPFEDLDTDGAIAHEPLLASVRERIAGALFFPADRVGDARKFTLQVAEHARRAGGDVRCGAGASELICERNRVTGVKLNTGEEMRADDIVVATGVDAPALTGPLGVRPPIQPAKGYSLTLTPPAGAVLPGLPVLDDAMHAAVVPLGERIRLVGTAEFAGADRTLRETRIDNLYRLFQRLLPDLAAQTPLSEGAPWTGLRPMSADGPPFIGPTKVGGLWLNCGHGHLGWTMSAGSASLLADQMEGVATAIDPSPYHYTKKRAAWGFW